MMTYQENSSGCSGAFICTPGVFGSSTISGSGGIADPSILRCIARCFARRAVMASRLGMFLYPTFFFGASTGTAIFTVPSAEAVSSFNFSNFSVVRGSPPSTNGVPPVVALLCCEALLIAGDADLVLGAFTAIESAVEATVLRLAFEPVRSANAANRGRGAEELFGCRTGGVPPALLVIRAASWLSEGRRAPPLGFFVANDVGFVAVVASDDAVGISVLGLIVVNETKGSAAKQHHHTLISPPSQWLCFAVQVVVFCDRLVISNHSIAYLYWLLGR